jgi:hypothetical protein
MAIDFSLLPPAQEMRDEPPSTILWTVVFFVLTLLGGFAVLLFWPKSEPSHTLWFWACLTLYPAGFAAFVVSRRYSVYEGRRLDAQEWNAARERYIQNVFAKAQVPFAVVGSAYRFTDDDKSNHAETIAQRALVLKAQPSIAQSGTVTARWLAPAVLDRSKWLQGPDTIRQDQVLEWLFGQLLDDLVETLEALPNELPLTVRLRVAADALESDVLAVWQRQWQSRKIRSTKVVAEASDLGLMIVDTWLDMDDGVTRKCATLLVTVQLNEILSKNPPDGSAEVGVALLLAPEDIVKRYALKRIALIHRPMQSAVDKLDHALTYALHWGNADPTSIARLWLSGLNEHSAAPLHTALSDTGVTAARSEPPSDADIDRTVGHAGVASGWLSLACASACAEQVSAPQLLVESCGTNIVLAVVAPALQQDDLHKGGPA